LAAEPLAQWRAHAVGDDESVAVHLEGLVAAGEDDRADAVAVTSYVDRSRAVDRPRAGLDRGGAQVVVELRAGHGRAPVGEPATRPGEQQGLTEAVGAQAVVDGVRAQPVAESQPLELADRSRGEAVAAGLVAREDRRVGEQHVDAQTREPG